jgi:type II secretory pathway pseudopilin PulG
MREKKRSFTLIGIIIVVVIIAIIASFLLPAIQKARMRARAINDVNNLKQLYAACIMYSNVNNGYLPYAGGTNSKSLWLLLPYVGWSVKVIAPDYTSTASGREIYDQALTGIASTPETGYAYVGLYDSTSLTFDNPSFSDIPIISVFANKYQSYLPVVYMNGRAEIGN